MRRLLGRQVGRHGRRREPPSQSLSGAISVGLLLLSSEASSQPNGLDFALRYEAPPECPTASEFLEQLNRYVRMGGGPSALKVTVQVRGETGEGNQVEAHQVEGYQLELQVNGSSRERYAGQDCGALVAGAVRRAALARTSAASGDAVWVAALAEAPSAAHWNASRTEPTRSRTPDRAASPEERTGAPAQHTNRQPPRGLGLSAGAQMLWGVLPRPVGALGAKVFSEWRSFWWELEFAQSARLGWTPLPGPGRDGGGSLSERRGGFAAGRAWRAGRTGELALLALGRVGIGRVRYSPEAGLGDASLGHLSVGARLGLSWESPIGLRLRLQGGADHSFAWNGPLGLEVAPWEGSGSTTLSHRPRRLQGTLGLQLGFRRSL